MTLYSLSDTIIQKRMAEIVSQWKIKILVETGTWLGLDTVDFSRMVPFVYGIDNNSTHIEQTKDTVSKSGQKNVEIIEGNSPDVLKELMPLLPDETLFFLDAHDMCNETRDSSYWPILDEIGSIRRGCGIITIHDFYIPDRPTFGYYVSRGNRLEYKYVQDELMKWSPEHIVEYNRESDSPTPVGIAYFYPK